MLDRKIGRQKREISFTVNKAKRMSTSIHFQGTVYNKKMSIYPIINYPIFSENTIICKFRDTDTCLSKCDSRAQLEPGQMDTEIITDQTDASKRVEKDC